MASLKEVKNRITSIKSTRQITSAMKMVASAKLHKAQGLIENMLPYQQGLNDILTKFLQSDISFESPYATVREVKRVAIVAFASNTSLCGAYNLNVLKVLEQKLEEYRSLGRSNLLVYPIGRKIEEAARKLDCELQGSYQLMAEKPSYAEAYKLATGLMEHFVAGEVDRVILIYHHFKSMGSQQLKYEDFLPIDCGSMKADLNVSVTSSSNDYIVEPSVEEVLHELIPKVLIQKIFTVLLDSNASEHAARMLAMQTATDNANELIQDLTKQYNKTRQQAITNELLDIVGGSMR